MNIMQADIINFIRALEKAKDDITKRVEKLESKIWELERDKIIKKR